jgi:hypothetical protein
MNEIQNYSFICQTDKFISIKNCNDESKQDNIFFFFIIAVIAMQLRNLRVLIGSFMIIDHVIHELYCQ